ncbi:murein hydrolase activator NlpD [Brenneria populi]|uniref:Murein hydrolase activator NlpD n=1 Tax=Brenneria populi TaxID=1505588 RepID=A0ABU6JVF2_9GAMM|nr:murein hydrolase activator NlpD [Brenneria populi Li et al. 2015]
MGSRKMNLRQIAVCTMVVLGLAGCSHDNTQSAPISSVGGSSGGGRSGAISTPPSQITASSGPQVATRDGRIVYNRSYNNIPKGSYNGGNTYTVKRGDTLFYIAWITGNDYRDLAQRNHIPEPYSLNVGQTLNLGNTAPGGINNSGGGMLAKTDSASGGVPVPPSMPAASSTPANSQIQTMPVASQSTNAYSDNSGKQNVGKMLPTAGAAATAPVTAPAAVASSNTAAVGSWRWPTDGKVIDSFSDSEGGNKGIDIAGSRGQSVVATASGRVVYAGNALRGYGNLIIIKHNDDYLSAYAHNESMLVREQQEVTAGQKIATMGSTGTSSVRLHFEIRYKGKSVNPLRFLPQR